MIKNKNVSDSDKLLMIVIQSLSVKEGFCFASNGALCELLGWNKRKLIRHLGNLIDGNYVNRSFTDNNGRSLRKLTPSVKIDTPSQNCHGGSVKNDMEGSVKSVTGGVSKVSPILEEVNRVEIIEEVNTQSEMDFEVFWNLYNKKVDRAKSWAKWKRLKPKERNEILLSVQEYVQANNETQYRKNPLTYLNGRCWEDDIIKPQKQNGSRFNQDDAEKLKQWIERDRTSH